MVACLWNHADIVQLLHGIGADLNTVSEEGWSALMFASSNNSVSAAQYLIKHGCALDIQDKV